MTTEQNENKYIEFLKSKMAISAESGFTVSDEELTPTLFPHVKDTVKWAAVRLAESWRDNLRDVRCKM